MVPISGLECFFFERRQVRKDPEAASLPQPVGYTIAKRPSKKGKITSRSIKSAEMTLDLVRKHDLVQELDLQISTRSPMKATAPTAAGSKHDG
jgi:hypothetical protein